MKYFLVLFFFFSLPLDGKVYDCFPFFNELELLKIRLNELDEVVHYFVLVESIETQRGKPKQLYFEENKALFTPYLHKIIHIIIDETHPEFSLWERENYQRNCILRGLKECNEEDIILISDVDEIPRKGLIPGIRFLLNRLNLNGLAFSMDLYRFHLNRIDSNQIPWNGTVATTYGYLSSQTPQHCRDRRNKWYSLTNGGWHFTWMGGLEKVRQKMQSVVEGCDSTDNLSDAQLLQWIESVPALPLDESFPSYILKHQEELRRIDFLSETSS